MASPKGGSTEATEEFIALKQIGRGSFADVYLCRHSASNEFVAEKRINMSILAEEERELMKEEIEILSQFKNHNHPHVVALLGTCQHDEILHFYLEYCPDGSLADELEWRKQGHKAFTDLKLWNYTYQIASGLAFIHKRKVIHRDLRPVNILKKRKNHLKISDIGVGAALAKRRASGSVLYLAPEVILETNLDFSCDVWSLGVIVYEMASLRPPFLATSEFALSNQITKEEPEPLSLPGNTELVDLVDSMLKKDAAKRPTSRKVVETAKKMFSGFSGEAAHRMGGYLDKPVRDKKKMDGEANGLKYAMAEMQGWSERMDDAHYIGAYVDHPFEKWSLFVICDGHGGNKVSRYVARHLKDILVEKMAKTFEIHVVTTDEIPTSLACIDTQVERVREAVKETFEVLDERMRVLFANDEKSGSTAIVVLISPNYLYLVNCGNSRAIISGIYDTLATKDHKATNGEERMRVEAAGGRVTNRRVNGCLAASRAFGDFELKKNKENPVISAAPKIYEWQRSPADEEFIVLASAGIWDALSNEGIVSFLKSRLLIEEKLSDVCSTVIDTCLAKDSHENMTMVLIVFDTAVKRLLSPEKRKTEKMKENQLDLKIRQTVAGLLRSVVSSEEMSPNDLFHTVMERAEASEDLKALLPPGGRLYAKRDFIEQIHREKFPETN